MLMKQTISGEKLQSLIIANGKSITRSAETLGITVDELKSYFEYDEFDIDFIEDIREKLQLFNIIDDIPHSLTSGAMVLKIEPCIKLQKMQEDLNAITIQSCQSDLMLLKKYLPALYDSNIKADYELFEPLQDEKYVHITRYIKERLDDALIIVDNPKSLTPASLDIIESYKKCYKISEESNTKAFKKLKKLHMLIEKFLPELYDSKMKSEVVTIDDYLQKLWEFPL